MLDTKNFVLKTGVRTFEASAYLKRRGADTVEVKKMFANSLDTYKERSQLVAGAEVYKGCAIACSNWEFPNRAHCGGAGGGRAAVHSGRARVVRHFPRGQ